MNYEFKTYPDGTSYVEIQEGVNFRPRFTYRINSYEDLWKLGQLLEACTYNNLDPIVQIPFLIDAQADRRFGENQSSGLYLVSEFLNSFKHAHYEVFHPHNPEVVEALFDKVTIKDNSSFIDGVLDQLAPVNNLILMSSDAGGFKPLMKLCDKIKWRGETYSASKSRKYVDGESVLTQMVDREDFCGKDVLIVDDLCVYGGTFKGLASMLRERNVGKLYLAVSHLTIQNHKGDDPVFNHFDKVFTTNSKFDQYYIEDSKGQPIVPKNLYIGDVL